ncbi:MAG TPA: MgtC/SapB family protein [Polyangia bacterium]|nr:MgtC/SapB family protein [Polyangia bacterium]
MDGFDPLEFGFWVPVLVSVACGAVIGLERQLHGKPAGIRTSILICLGTTIFVRLGVLLSGGNTDPTRVLGQVVTGIGFLGAGVILTQGPQIKGVTSAAAVWVLAGIGAAVGLGFHKGAVALSLTTVAVLVGVEFLERGSAALRKGVHSRDEK